MPPSPYQIDIADEQDCLSIVPHRVRDVVSEVLRMEEVVAAEISLALIDDAAIWEVNRTHLDHDEPTDVISFVFESTPELDRPSADPSDRRGRGRTLSGEIVVSVEMAIAKAAEYHREPFDEVALYLIHGALHLCGYDDLTPEERSLMRIRENEALRRCGLAPANIPFDA